MKTIEQAAKEYAGITEDKYHNKSLCHSPYDMAAAFAAGVEFAQRWIPVEEEFPYGECLIKNDKGKTSYFDFTGANDYDIQYFLVENCTESWRPIELI